MRCRDQVMAVVADELPARVSQPGSTRSSCSTGSSAREMGKIVDNPDAGALGRVCSRSARSTIVLEAVGAREWLAASGWDPAYGARPRSSA